jgi:hypothetical protein
VEAGLMADEDDGARPPVSWWVQAQQTGDPQAFYAAAKARQETKRAAPLGPIEAMRHRPWPLTRGPHTEDRHGTD